MWSSKVVVIVTLLAFQYTLAHAASHALFKKPAGSIKPIRPSKSISHPALGALSPEISAILKVGPFSQEQIAHLFDTLKQSTDKIITQVNQIGLDNIFTKSNSFFSANVPFSNFNKLKTDFEDFSYQLIPTGLDTKFFQDIATSALYNKLEHRNYVRESFNMQRRLQCLLFAGFTANRDQQTLSVAVQSQCLDLSRVNYYLPMPSEGGAFLKELLNYKIIHG